VWRERVGVMVRVRRKGEGEGEGSEMWERAEGMVV
jgi:hypothetical protein